MRVNKGAIQANLFATPAAPRATSPAREHVRGGAGGRQVVPDDRSAEAGRGEVVLARTHRPAGR